MAFVQNQNVLYQQNNYNKGNNMDSITFHRISFDITFRCTLRCKLCCAYAPYFSEPVPHYTYSEIIKSMEHFFKIVDYVDIFTIGGGEPFLHESLPEILNFLGAYRGRIGRLEVITNGTILPQKKLLVKLKEKKTRVLLDDYGPDLSYKVPEIVSLFDLYKITYEHRYNSNTEKGAYCTGWVNLLDFSEEPASYNNAKMLFDKCLQANELRCHPVINNKIYVCPTYEFLIQKGILVDSKELYIDLKDDTQSIEKQREKTRQFLKIDYLPSCAYCNGFCEDSKRYIPAEQLR